MSWYNTYSESTRRFEQLIDSKPTLQQLLDVPDFLDLLKAYNPKLLEYISNSNDIPKQIIKYITEVPLESDSDSRKFRLPLLTLMVIETNTLCIINSFFKIDPSNQKTYFISSFYMLLDREEEVLPLLCGYFAQMNVMVWNNRYKQVIDLVYDNKQPLFLLANHTYNRAIVNTLMLYLNLDLTRNPNVFPQRTQTKIKIVQILYDQMRAAFETTKKDPSKNQRSQTVVQNICDILIEIVEKYYLISDGKNMLQYITTQENVDLVVQILMAGSEISHSVVGLVLWLMRYYCLSSFNQQDLTNPEHSKKNQERLEAQPFIKVVIDLIPYVTDLISQTNKFTLYHSRLVDIFIIALELSSKKVGETIKKTKFLQTLISLLFKWPQLSIVHKQIQRAIFLMFNSERKICEEYRKYLFCTAGIIQLTVGQCLKKVDKLGESFMKYGWFAFLMKIVKIYSKIQTDDEEINKAIIQRSVLWQKFCSSLMRPFEALSFKDLGSYEGIIEKPPVQYTVKAVSGAFGAVQPPPASKKMIEELIQEESMQQFLTTMPQKSQQSKSSNLSEDSLFMIQDFQKTQDQPITKPQINFIPANTTTLINANGSTNTQIKIQFQQPLSQIQTKPIILQVKSLVETLATNSTIEKGADSQQNISVELKKDESKNEEPKKEQIKMSSFQQFMSSKKQQVGQEMNLVRKNSSEKRLSANKSRVTSPSPKKKRWEDVNTEDQNQQKPNQKLVPAKTSQTDHKKQKISLTTATVKPPPIPANPRPMIPHSPANDPRKQQKKPSFQNFQNALQPPTLNQSQQIEEMMVTSSITTFSQKSQGIEKRSMSTKELSTEIDDIQQLRNLSKSAVNLSQLRNIQFKKNRLVKPENSQFRKVQQKDKVFLEFLGVKF